MVIRKCMEDVFMEMGSTVCGIVGMKLNDSKHEKTKEGSPFENSLKHICVCGVAN